MNHGAPPIGYSQHSVQVLLAGREPNQTPASWLYPDVWREVCHGFGKEEVSSFEITIQVEDGAGEEIEWD